ncbi:arginase family protein [Rhizobium aegyptiacum]|uniref:arginase family protein n=1 Tax=Rhizobium aegyptiacum TaxID=1764550 RepID=UPI0007E5B27E|nr:arginase family protein [Rhizobium aegyptiacum]
MTSKTLRLNFPQWQGGTLPTYHFGSQLLSFLAPPASGEEVTIDVDPPNGEELLIERGIKARSQVLRQADQSLRILREKAPDRVVVLGGDCLVDLGPFAYLSERYGDDLAILWVDAHPDIATTALTTNAHAMVLGNLIGRGDPELVSRVSRPVEPANVMFAGLYDMSPAERRIFDDLGLKTATPSELTVNSDPVIEWLRDRGTRHVAIHFDLDVLSPTELRTLFFSRPDAPRDAFNGIPQGRMLIAEVVRLLSDVARQADVVGLGITEFLPWDMVIVRDMLRELPILRDGG